MESGPRLVYEHCYQRRRLDDYFYQRSLKENLTRSLPFLNIGEVDRRAKAKGVYILTKLRATEISMIENE